MLSREKSDQGRVIPEQYRIRNRSEFNAAPKQFRNLTFWIKETVIASWYILEKSGKPGGFRVYGDLAIQTMAMVKALSRLAGRQCQGFLESVFELMN